jgi:hypothetical protein
MMLRYQYTTHLRHPACRRTQLTAVTSMSFRPSSRDDIKLGREPINLQGRSAGQSPLCPVATKFRSAGKCREWDGPAVLLPLTAFNWGL